MSNTEDSVEHERIRALREAHIGRLFLEAHRSFSGRAVEKLRARDHPGLGLAHTALLAHLDLEGTRITTLADRAGMTKQAMGQLVLDLARLGYVGREPDPVDGRAARVTFTEEGWRFLHDASAVKRELEAEYVALLGERRFRALRADLAALLAGDRGSIEAPDAPRAEP